MENEDDRPTLDMSKPSKMRFGFALFDRKIDRSEPATKGDIERLYTEIRVYMSNSFESAEKTARPPSDVIPSENPTTTPPKKSVLTTSTGSNMVIFGLSPETYGVISLCVGGAFGVAVILVILAGKWLGWF